MKKFIIISLFLVFSGLIYSQKSIEEVRLSNGKTIIVYDDYTWREKQKNYNVPSYNSNIPTEYSNGTRVLRRSVEVKEGNNRRNIVTTTYQPAVNNTKVPSYTNTEVNTYNHTQRINLSENKNKTDSERNIQTQAQTHQQTKIPIYNDVSKPSTTKTSSKSTYSSSSPSNSTGGTVHVKGYFRKNGTYVEPHTRRAPTRRK